MKKIFKVQRIIIWLFILVVILFLNFLLFYQSKQDYLGKLEKLNNNISVFNFYTMIYDDYFEVNFSFPKNINEVEKFKNKINNPLYNFSDPFSKQQKDLLYIPVYNKNNKLVEGYMLLSAGIDGKINTIVKDSVFFDDINTFSLYNTFQDSIGDIFEFNDDFNLYNYFFGEKDLLIACVDGVNNFITNAVNAGIFSPSEFYSKYSRLLNNGNISLACAIKGNLTKKKGEYIIMSDNEFSVFCKIYKDKSYNVLEDGKVVTVIGKCNLINIKRKRIYINNCIIID